MEDTKVSYESEYNENFSSFDDDEFRDDTIVAINKDGEEENFFVIGSVKNGNIKYLVVSKNETNETTNDDASEMEFADDLEFGATPEFFVLKKDFEKNKKIFYRVIDDKNEINNVMKLFDKQIEESFLNENNNQ
jgi:hypothetical protein